MARIRSIKPEFFTSEQIADLSPTTRLLFIGMWVFSDDNGVHPASVKTLKMEIFPADVLSPQQISDMINELINASLLSSYVVEGKAYWMITGWKKHQKIEKPTYRYPLPAASPTPRRLLDDPSATEQSRAEQSRVESISCAATSFEKIYAFGCDLFPQLAPQNNSAIHQWINAGCSIELDIMPELKRYSGKPIKSWNYFTSAIMDAKATRESPAPKGTSRGGRSRSEQAKSNVTVL